MPNRENQDTASWDVRQVRRAATPENRSASGGEHRPTDGRRPTEGRRPTDGRRRGRRNPRGTLLYVLFILLTSAILAGVGWLLANDLCAFNKKPLTATIEVTQTDSLPSVATKLKKAGLIEYKWFFKLFGVFANAEDKIGEGSYELNTDMDYRALITYMKSGAGSLNGETVKVTIPEGYTVEQIIALLAKNKVSGAEALTEAAKNATFEYEYIDNKNLGSISRLEGFLFPDTYDFYVGEKAQSALNRLIKNFDRKLTAELRTAIKASGYTIPQVVTIASLIERETDGKDHAKIASVIYNRLNNPNAGTVGKLQIDASVLYGLPAHEGALTSADKEVDTPYNLYKYKGLPPTPIGNPGLASLNAAIAPEKTDYYYYALGKDKAHHFFKSYNEHVNFTKSAQYAGDSK